MKKCIHPIKASRIMVRFLDDIHNLTYEDFDYDAPPTIHKFNDMEFKMPATKQYHASVKLKRDKEVGFYARLNDLLEYGNVTIGVASELFKQYDACFSDLGFKQVRADAIHRYPHLKGYSILTFVLLHELGHFMTEDEADEKQGKYSIECTELVHKYIPQEYWNYFHAEQYNERLATDWAAHWLSIPENGKKAKQFEKEFFACYKDE